MSANQFLRLSHIISLAKTDMSGFSSKLSSSGLDFYKTIHVVILFAIFSQPKNHSLKSYTYPKQSTFPKIQLLQVEVHSHKAKKNSFNSFSCSLIKSHLLQSHLRIAKKFFTIETLSNYTSFSCFEIECWLYLSLLLEHLKSTRPVTR